MNQKSIHILHIEDDQVDRMVVERVLRKTDLNLEMYHASNGLEALNKLRGENGENQLNPLPQIVLLDINMPKMNGFEFLKEIRTDEKLKHLSVCMITTSADEEDIRQAHSYNVAAYVLKPVDIAVFESTFRILAGLWKLSEYPRYSPS